MCFPFRKKKTRIFPFYPQDLATPIFIDPTYGTRYNS